MCPDARQLGRHLDDVDERREPRLDAVLGARRGLDADVEAPGPVAVGLVEVDGDDPAPAPAQQRQRADEHVVAAGGLDRVAPWSCRAGVERRCNRAGGDDGHGVFPSGHTRSGRHRAGPGGTSRGRSARMRAQAEVAMTMIAQEMRVRARVIVPGLYRPAPGSPRWPP